MDGRPDAAARSEAGDTAASLREEALAERKAAAVSRDHAAWQREEVAELRERLADEREAMADDRDRTLAEREQWLADYRREAWATGTTVEQSAWLRGEARQVIARSREALDRRGDRVDRQEAGDLRNAAQARQEQDEIDVATAAER